jgi:SRSO17 transposase
MKMSKNVYDQLMNMQDKYLEVSLENIRLKKEAKIYPTIHHLFDHKNKLEETIRRAFDMIMNDKPEIAAALLKRAIDGQI